MISTTKLPELASLIEANRDKPSYELADLIINFANQKANNSELETLIEAVEQNTSINLVLDQTRFREASNARFIFCKIANERGFKLHEIGKMINRDHASVLHAINKATIYIQNELSFSNLYHKTLSTFIQNCNNCYKNTV